MKNFKAIVQARMGSSRLPGKALWLLGGEPCLYHIINRLKKVDQIDEIIIATPAALSNEPIWEYCTEHHPEVKIWKGSEDDVLGRVLQAAQFYDAENIVDITADCPLIDPGMIERMINLHNLASADLTTNVAKRLWPDGLDCQIYTREVLEALHIVVSGYFNRLHTGWNIIAHLSDVEQELKRELKIQSFSPSPKNQNMDWPNWRLTIDEIDDAKTIDLIMRELGEDCSWEQIRDYIQEHPEKLLNRSVRAKIPGQG